MLTLKMYLPVGKSSAHTEQKLNFSIKDFFNKCDLIRRKLRIGSHLLKKSLMENFIFGAATVASIIWSTQSNDREYFGFESFTLLKPVKYKYSIS